jgi:hypothetical protein
MLPLLILVASLALSGLIAVATHGRVVILLLPLMFGLPLAGVLHRRR